MTLKVSLKVSLYNSISSLLTSFDDGPFLDMKLLALEGFLSLQSRKVTVGVGLQLQGYFLRHCICFKIEGAKAFNKSSTKDITGVNQLH